MKHISYSANFLNKQNCHIWGFENPQVIKERPLHPEKISVFDALFRPKVWLAEIPPNMCQKIGRKLRQKNEFLQHFAFKSS